MGLKEYLPGVFTLLLAGGQAFLVYSFGVSNLRAPGTPFVLALILSSAGFLLCLLVFAGSLPRFRDSLIGERFSRRFYWASFVMAVLVSLVLAGAAIMAGSVEYTQFQAALN